MKSTNFLSLTLLLVSGLAFAGVIGEDDRKLLSKSTVGLSLTEHEQAMRCTGHVYCPGGRGSAKMQSAGAICAPGDRSAQGICAADRLATVRHLFVDEKTHRFIPKLEKCEFQNYRGHVSTLVTGDITVDVPSIENNNPHKAGRADKVVVRLLKPIPGCDPYDLPDITAPPSENSDLIALTHVQEDHEGIYDGKEPLAYPCQVTRVFTSLDGNPALFYSNCDATGLASGGFNLTRNRDNRLAVSGMFLRAGGVHKNGWPYSEATDGTKHFTLSISTDGAFLRMARHPGEPSSVNKLEK